LVGPKTGLDTVLKRKIPNPRRESNPDHPIVQPVASRYTDWAFPDDYDDDSCWPGFDSRQELENFLFATASGPALDIQWAPGILSPGGKSGRSVKLTTHLQLVPRLKMRGFIPPHRQYVFMVWCLVKHRDNFTLHLCWEALL
jgi:hypothetical protein